MATVTSPTSLTHGASGVVVGGTGFGASQGAGKVELVSGATVVAQTVTNWTDTAITITVAAGPFNQGRISLRVTPNAGGPASLDVSLAGVARKFARQAGRVGVR